MYSNSYALITPTYSGHFPFIEKYLKSLDEFSKGPKIPVYLTVERNDFYDLSKITKKYKNTNCVVLAFEDILEHFELISDTEILLRTLGRFSYQTLKKFYTALYIKEEKSLIIDSESMLIRDFDLSQLFSQYFENPFICYSPLRKRKFVSSFTKNVVDNASYLLGVKDDSFFLENFVWFYEKRILLDLFKRCGSPYELVMRLEKEKKTNLFEIQIYHQFIHLNKEKYGYKSINVVDEIENRLGKDKIDSYMNVYYDNYKGNCGILERAPSCISKNDWSDFADLFIELNFNLIRSEYSSEMKYHTKFIKKVNPVILCASQDHSFGINSSVRNKLLDLTGTRNNYWVIVDSINYLKHKAIVKICYHTINMAVKLLCNPIKNLLK